VKVLLRYAAYVAFAGAAPVFWLMFAFLVFGFLPLPGDPACHFEPEGCPERPMIVQVFGTIALLGSFPLTVLAFVPFRKTVRRKLGLPETRSAR
jgi:hypothetical protein